LLQHPRGRTAVSKIAVFGDLVRCTSRSITPADGSAAQGTFEYQEQSGLDKGQASPLFRLCGMLYFRRPENKGKCSWPQASSMLEAANAAVPKVTAAQAKKMIANGDTLVVDVRDAPEVAANGCRN
jgi:hypothetical protein